MFKLITDVIAALAVIAITGMMLYVVIISWYDEIQEWRAIAKKNKKERG